jgi:hypothetical protein
MKQLRNPLFIVPAILVGSLVTSYYQAWMAGALVHWTDFRTGFGDFSVHAVLTTVGWLLFRSPWATTITQLTGSSTGPGDQKTDVKVTVESPAAQETK